MKNTKNKVLVIALAVCLIAVISVGSLAWFTASDSATNTFYVANSDDDTADDVFSVEVYEYTEDSPNNRVYDNETYSDITPGATLIKEAHVANTGYYDQYIRVTVTISDAAVWQSVLGNDFNDATLLNCFDGFDMSMWTNVTTKVENDKVIIVMYYDGILDGNDDNDNVGSDITVFEAVNIPESLTRDHVIGFDDDRVEGFTIDVFAEAVQTENVGNNALDAFTTVGLV